MLHGNNKIIIAPTKHMKSQHYTKYINIQYYYIRELVNKRKLTIKQILELEILADKITKKLSIEIFRKLQVLF